MLIFDSSNDRARIAPNVLVEGKRCTGIHGSGFLQNFLIGGLGFRDLQFSNQAMLGSGMETYHWTRIFCARILKRHQASIMLYLPFASLPHPFPALPGAASSFLSPLAPWGLVLHVNAKNFCVRILPIWSTKWSLFTKLFAQMGCKSRDESNDAN